MSVAPLGSESIVFSLLAAVSLASDRNRVMPSQRRIPLDGEAFDAGDVLPFPFSFNLFDIVPQFVFKVFRQSHHPVQDGEKAENVFAIQSRA